MPKGIKNEVAIIGMGCTKFGELWNKTAEDLIVEAFQEAIADAGIEKKDINAAWFATVFDAENVGKSAVRMATTLKLPYIPVTRIENFCASGTEAFRAACYAVASGAADIALALGCEKLKDTGYGGLPDFGTLLGTDSRIMLPNLTAPGGFAQAATSYFAKHGLTAEEGKRAMAHISSKSHHNGSLNPKAHLRTEVSIETIMKAPIIAYPLGLFDCCGVSDGAAAVIVCRASKAKEFRKDPIYVKGVAISVTSGRELYHTSWDGSYIETTVQAGIAAYKEAGVTKPREEISMFEVHDCFSITELLTYEDLQISQRGKAVEDIHNGFYDLDGKIPCNPSGGLKSFGHPIGATGIRMIYEMYLQLQGRADKRQINDPRLGMTMNLGGFPALNLISISIVGKDL
jgi:acetyl-CoA C-acetyltransferase